MSTTVPVSPFTPHDDDGGGDGVFDEGDEDEDDDEEEEDDDDFEVDLERPFAAGLAFVLFSLAFNASTCLALSCVSTRMGLCPAFCNSVRGMISNASAMARYGHCATPSTSFARADRRTLTAISVAPPPGESRGRNMTLRATPIASCRFRSTSLSMSFDGPRNKIVQACGFWQRVRKV